MGGGNKIKYNFLNLINTFPKINIFPNSKIKKSPCGEQIILKDSIFQFQITKNFPMTQCKESWTLGLRINKCVENIQLIKKSLPQGFRRVST